MVPADGLLAGAAGVVVVEAAAAAAEGAGEGEGLLVEAAAGEALEATGSTFGTAGEAADTTTGLREGGVTGTEDTTMAGTLPEFFFSSGASGCWGSWPVSTATAVTVWACTLAGV